MVEQLLKCAQFVYKYHSILSFGQCKVEITLKQVVQEVNQLDRDFFRSNLSKRHLIQHNLGWFLFTWE